MPRPVAVVFAVALAAVVARADDGPTFAGRPAAEWEEQLRSPDWHARWFAVRAIGRMGTSFDRGTADLVEALGDSERLVGDLAAEALASRGAAAAPGVARLLALGAKRPAERGRFLLAIGTLGAPVPDTAMAALAPAFIAGRETGSAERAIIALAAHAPDPAVGFLVTCLADKDSLLRIRAQVALHKIGAPAKEAVPALIRALETDEVASYAAAALGTIGDTSEPVVSALSRGRSSESNDVRAECAAALAALGEPGLPALMKTLDSELPEERERALDLLAQFPRHGADLLPAYLEALRDDSLVVRRKAAFSVTKLDGVADLALPALRRSMREPRTSGPVRAAVTAAVLRFQPEDEEATKTLLEMARSSWTEFAYEAMGFLLNTHHASSIPLVRSALSDPERERRADFVRLLDEVSFGDSRVVASLLPLLADSDADVRRVALSVLARCGNLDSATVAKVRPSLADPESKVRAAAARAIGCAGPEARAAAADVRGLLKSPDTDVRVAAAVALVRSTPNDGADLVPVLVEGLRAAPTKELAEALESLGPSAAPAAEPLLDLARDAKDYKTRVACRAALESVLPSR